jgi:TatD family-associated radical SAM protein
LSHRSCHVAAERLFVQLTDRCTLECRFCPRSRYDFHLGDWDLELRERPGAAELIASIGDPRPYREVVFSGLGEPTLRLNLLLEVAAEVKRRGGRVHLETDGLANLVHDRDIPPRLAGHVDSVTVSMNAQEPGLYEHLCRPNLPGSFAAMQRFTGRLRDHVPEVSVSAIEGIEGVDMDACARLAHELGAGFSPRQLDCIP